MGHRSSEKFCLRWNDFESNISGAFRELREEKDFFDVTLACDDEDHVDAHRVILSACSPFFRYGTLSTSVAGPVCLSRIRIIFIPDPNFVHPGSATKEFKNFNPKKWFGSRSFRTIQILTVLLYQRFKEIL
jgi:hypothetical protein